MVNRFSRLPGCAIPDSMTEPRKSPRKRRSLGPYLSAEMIARRSRILRTAIEILDEGGEEHLTIARLCERAGVAARTLYRAFGDREGIIYAALAEHMGSLTTVLSHKPRGQDVDAVFREYDWIAEELFRGPEFARLIINFYFSSKPREAVLQDLRSVPYQRIEKWLMNAEQRGELLPGIDLQRIAMYQTDTEYVLFHKWATGRVPDECMALELKVNFLMTALSVVNDGFRPRITDRLEKLHTELATRRTKLDLGPVK